MEKMISWTNYWVLVGTLLLLYYGWVLIVYYRNDLFTRRASNKKQFSALSPQFNAIKPIDNPPLAGNTSRSIDSTNTNEPETVTLLPSFTNELVAYLEQAGKAGAARQEILFSVTQLIKRYSSRELLSYQEAINQLLHSECEASCHVRLEEEEIDRVWKG